MIHLENNEDKLANKFEIFLKKKNNRRTFNLNPQTDGVANTNCCERGLAKHGQIRENILTSPINSCESPISLPYHRCNVSQLS